MKEVRKQQQQMTKATVTDIYANFRLLFVQNAIRRKEVLYFYVVVFFLYNRSLFAF